MSSAHRKLEFPAFAGVELLCLSWVCMELVQASNQKAPGDLELRTTSHHALRYDCCSFAHLRKVVRDLPTRSYNSLACNKLRIHHPKSIEDFPLLGSERRGTIHGLLDEIGDSKMIRFCHLDSTTVKRMVNPHAIVEYAISRLVTGASIRFIRLRLAREQLVCRNHADCKIEQ